MSDDGFLTQCFRFCHSAPRPTARTLTLWQMLSHSQVEFCCELPFFALSLHALTGFRSFLLLPAIFTVAPAVLGFTLGLRGRFGDDLPCVCLIFKSLVEILTDRHLGLAASLLLRALRNWAAREVRYRANIYVCRVCWILFCET